MEKETITFPIEVMEEFTNILFQDMNFHNPHEIVEEARKYLLGLGVILISPKGE